MLETENLVKDPLLPEKVCGKKGEIEFKNVSFKYPDGDDYVLKNISFKAEKGMTVAIIGSTGSGKSTLLNLIPRFYDATEGEVLVDGVNVKNLAQHDLREKLGYVPQKSVLFSGTIQSNLCFGAPDAERAELKSGCGGSGTKHSAKQRIQRKHRARRSEYVRRAKIKEFP